MRGSEHVTGAPPSDVVCFTRSRWGSLDARDHPLMSRFARSRRVFVVEPPVRDHAGGRAFVEEQRGPDALVLCVPHLPVALEPVAARRALGELVRELRARHALRTDVLWAEARADLEHARTLTPRVSVWDRRGQPDLAPELPVPRERAALPDLVLIGAPALLDPHRASPHVRVVPPAIDLARVDALPARMHIDPVDLAPVPGPRIGLAALLDTQLDLEVVKRVADELRDHFLVALGAPRGLDPRTLPCRENVRWLGEKRRDQRLSYVAGWDVAIVPQRGGMASELALEALALAVPVVVAPAVELGLGSVGPPLVRYSDAAGVASAVEAALRAPREACARAADALRPRLGWDAAFRAVEGWLDAARGAAITRRAEIVLARSSA